MASKKAKKPEPAAAEIRHPELKIVKHLGDQALTSTQAKELLGWDVGEGEKKFKESIPEGLSDLSGRKVVCRFDTSNRPLDLPKTLSYLQDLLHRNWNWNGDTIVIGQSGEVMNGQKRLIALALAGEKYNSEKEGKHWKGLGETEPRMEVVVVYGLSESQEVRRTIDNVQPRTFADTLYTDPNFFPKAKGKDRRRLGRMFEYATRLVWSRTGAKDAFRPYVTPSEYDEFRKRHAKLKECVKHIDEENGKGASRKDGGNGIGRWISPGYAAGLMYLVASCRTDSAKYRGADNPSERQINFAEWDKAEAFFVALNTDSSPLVKALLAFRKPLAGVNGTKTLAPVFSDAGSFKERLAILAKAWPLFLEKPTSHFKEIADQEQPFLAYTSNEDGIWNLSETPTVGGIDCGSGREEDESDEDAAGDPPAPSAEAIEAGKEKIKAEKESPPTPVASENGKTEVPATTPKKLQPKRKQPTA